MKFQGFHPPTRVVEMAAALIEVATSNRHDPRVEETFIECHMCGEWDSHKEGCPVPALVAWMEE